MHEQRIAGIAERALAKSLAPSIIRVAEHADGGVVVETGRGADARSAMMLASITKLVTAAAVFVALERGALELDEPVAPMLPDAVRAALAPHPRAEAATIRELLSHRSGFRDAYEEGSGRLVRRMRDGDFVFSLEDMARWTAELGPAPIGHRVHYADVSFDLLGAALERRLGRPYGDVIRELVAEPLGLEGTRLAGDDRASAPPIEIGGELVDRTAFLRSGASGGLLSTAEDLDRLLAGLFEGRLGRRDTFDEVGPARPLQLQMRPIRYSAGIMDARVGWPWCPPRTLLGHLGSTGASPSGSPRSARPSSAASPLRLRPAGDAARHEARREPVGRSGRAASPPARRRPRIRWAPGPSRSRGRG